MYHAKCQRLTSLTLQALKLAERAIQHADTLAVLSDGYVRAARVSHAQGQYEEAKELYVHASDGSPGNIIATVGLAQIQLHSG